ncbi:acetyltransferase, GNAT family protein [Plesiocystis pacifica SIR-1]|uniref:Acetyltransferase, GNAT family protein n=1 Tax=Plesiocystis pacifica SIR-1 TaxID=391625 RepID=A6GBE3_9BACT|nr:GNAT family N-acetyltransferase [Plesiocystis pacifica]EDM76852.1 acetyltransferase, GNAT family protein [Plesiocystis pacifica SIR-1]
MAALCYRVARVDDIPAMMSIRNNVRENALVHAVIGHEDYVQAMTVDGRAWVCERDGEVVGFACGRKTQGDVWALFVREAHEGRGIGSALMERVEGWMVEVGVDRIWLVTAAETRAERLYRHRGWIEAGVRAKTGEVEFVFPAPAGP